VRRADPGELASVPGIGPRIAREIHHFYRSGTLAAEEAAAQDSLRRLGASGATAIDLWDPGYPELLSRIYDPPPVLFTRGSFAPSDGASVAVVGTRRPSPYGLEMAGYFGRELAAAGFTVVSGLARGIDTRAHSEALRAGGRTLAVMGTGLDHCYPPENRKLAASISSSGALLSEFEPGTTPEPGNFPRRNRVISGLSLGTVLIESDINGGAMITAHTALEQNREVFAVPGKAGSPTSRGCHALIREGKAKLVETLDDIVSEILAQCPSGFRPATRPPGITPTLNPRERHLHGLLGADPIHIDVLAARSGLPVQHLVVDLLSLEMKGLARQHPGKYFTRSV
jgi:DNA processing protein